MIENLPPDQYLWTRDLQILTPAEHGIRSLGSVVHRTSSAVTTPASLHYHSKMLEVYCIIKGIRFTQIHVNGNILDFTTTGSQVLLTYPYEIHCNGSEPLAPCEFYALQLDVSDPGHLLCMDTETSQRLYDLLTTLPSRHIALKAQQIQELPKIFSLLASGDPVSHICGAHYLSAFLFELGSGTPLYGKETRRLDPRIAASIAYLNNNLSESLRLDQLAEASGYSLSRFKVRFKEEVGITPAEYITIQKIEAAKKRLVHSNESITDLAYSFGFSSSNYFCSVFKKLVGVTPLVYRSRNQE